MTKAREGFVSAEELHWEQVRKQNDIMVANNVSMSRQLKQENKILHRIRKTCAPLDHNSDASEDSIDEILARMNQIPETSTTNHVLLAVQQRLQKPELYASRQRERTTG